MEDTTKLLAKEIEEIRQRNLRVELDKAWETSWTRRIAISLLTYFLISIVFYLIGVADYLLNAIIPTVAYLISTLGMKHLKRIWQKGR